MADPVLILANRNYSSWSLRPWLAARHSGIAFQETVIPLRQPDTHERILRLSPSGKLPALRHGDVMIWESLSICEYLAETFPDARLWPDVVAARARARSVSAEMLAGFRDLRQHLPMNFRRRYTHASWPPAAQGDIDRIIEIWTECRSLFGSGGPFLFGRFSIADAMYAPVVSRFATYAVPLPKPAQTYCDALWSLPAMTEWMNAAKAEPWTIDEYDKAPASLAPAKPI